MGGLEASASQRFASNYEPQRMTPPFYSSAIVLSIPMVFRARYTSLRGSFLKSPLLISTNVGQNVRPVISLTLDTAFPDCKFVSRNPEKSRNIGGRSINGPNLKRRARISPFRWCQHESCGEFETHLDNCSWTEALRGSASLPWVRRTWSTRGREVVVTSFFREC